MVLYTAIMPFTSWGDRVWAYCCTVPRPPSLPAVLVHNRMHFCFGTSKFFPLDYVGMLPLHFMHVSSRTACKNCLSQSAIQLYNCAGKT